LRLFSTFFVNPERVIIVADRGFRRAAFLAFMNALGFGYVVRICGRVHVKGKTYVGLLEEHPLPEGERFDLGRVHCREDEVIETRVVAEWMRGCDERWYLAANLTKGVGALCGIYLARMEIEEGFRDLKSHRYGAKLRYVMLADAERYERLLMIWALGMWLHFGQGLAAVRRNLHLGLSSAPNTRRDLSVVRIGRETLTLPLGGPPALLRAMAASRGGDGPGRSGIDITCRRGETASIVFRAQGKATMSCDEELCPKAVGRLSLYRRLLRELFDSNTRYVFSRQLAEVAGSSPAQVRRDLMPLGCKGDPHRGYDVRELARSIDECLDAHGGQRAALVGVGNLGRALVGRFAGRNSKLQLAAAFDSDLRKADQTITDCRVYPIADLPRIVRELGIAVAIIAVPASEAQDVADACTGAGVRGILNFAPVPVRAPEGVYVLHVDLTMALETVAFFAKREKHGTSTVSGA